MSAATRRLAEAILAQDDALDVDELDALIQAEIRAVVGTPNPEPVNTIDSLDGIQKSIEIFPVTTDEGDLTWYLHIPGTLEDHFYDDGTPVIPYGEQGWSSLAAAVASLSLAVKYESVKFNDGRVAR